MNEVRLLVQGTARDPAAFSAFMKREAALLAEKEPGTRLMEIFVDEASGSVVVHEVYRDADAFIDHSENVIQGTRLQEFMEVFELKRMTFLTQIDDERVRAIAQQFNAVQASHVAGFAR